MPRPLAYHITWGTYGTRLHGDGRGTVDREHNQFGTPVLGRDKQRNDKEYENLKFPPIKLTRDQCIFIEEVTPSVCERGHWMLHTCAAAPDHVHVVLTSEFDPKVIRNLLKRWIGQSLSKTWSLEKDHTWWAEDGSTKWISDTSYLQNAVKYVHGQRTGS